MRKLLIPLLVALALPTAANAESVWLLIVISVTGGNVLEKIEMKDMNQCEEQGAVWINSKRTPLLRKFRAYECIKGK